MSESFLTVRTCVWFYSRVRPIVLSQGARVSEALNTNRAFEGLFFRVGPDVRRETVFSAGCIAAQLAFPF